MRRDIQCLIVFLSTYDHGEAHFGLNLQLTTQIVKKLFSLTRGYNHTALILDMA